MKECTFHTTDVTLTTTTSSSTPMAGQRLYIYCNIDTTLNNITASVNLMLKRNSITINNWNSFTRTDSVFPPSTYHDTGTYVINMLNTSIDGSTFQCEATVSATSTLKITSSFLLKVTGE